MQNETMFRQSSTPRAPVPTINNQPSSRRRLAEQSGYPHQQTDPLACSAKRDRLVLLALSDPKRRQMCSKSPYPTGCSAEGLLMQVDRLLCALSGHDTKDTIANAEPLSPRFFPQLLPLTSPFSVATSISTSTLGVWTRKRASYIRENGPSTERGFNGKFIVRTAFSREPPYKPDGGKTYAQDIMWEDKAAFPTRFYGEGVWACLWRWERQEQERRKRVDGVSGGAKGRSAEQEGAAELKLLKETAGDSAGPYPSFPLFLHLGIGPVPSVPSRQRHLHPFLQAWACHDNWMCEYSRISGNPNFRRENIRPDSISRLEG
jgi:hypothetical protein